MTAVLLASRMGLGSGYVPRDADARRIINAMNPRPQRPLAQKIDQKVQALKTAGLWSKFVLLNPFYLATSLPASRKDWCFGTEIPVLSVPGASVSFAAGLGVSQTAGGRLSSSFTEPTPAVNGGYSIGVVCNAVNQGDGGTLFASDGATFADVRIDGNSRADISSKARNLPVDLPNLNLDQFKLINVTLTRTGTSSYANRTVATNAYLSTASVSGSSTNSGFLEASGASITVLGQSGASDGFNRAIQAFWVTSVPLTDAECISLARIFNRGDGYL